MTTAEANKRLRYYRIQKLHEELRSYKLDTKFIEQALCQFFTVGDAVIYLALKHEPIKDVYYEHLDLDMKWAKGLAQKAFTRQYKAKKKRDQIPNQAKLKL